MKRLTISAFVFAILGAVSLAESSWAQSATQAAQQDKTTVRLATVRTPRDGGLLDELIARFESRTDYRVEVSVGKLVYEDAKAGKVDVVLSHFGHSHLGVEPFVQEGYGLWPQAVLSSRDGFIIPKGDPAKVAGLTDPVEILRRIAESRSTFIANDDESHNYAVETLWHAAGSPDREGWYVDLDAKNSKVAELAASKNAYSVWGATAFKDWQDKTGDTQLSMVLPDGPVMSRLMVADVVNPERFPEANVEGAKAFVQFLLEPETQAQIAAFKSDRFPAAPFLPAGRNNVDGAISSGSGN
ncbi:substrate-binding domain-containing protein [Ensifer sp. 4252]|uniref:substrate-binding domain-containing protein n=1 Tax=Ensifer sp. 4252 TaxID=3373915 RepID=UPI003D22DE03